MIPTRGVAQGCLLVFAAVFFQEFFFLSFIVAANRELNFAFLPVGLDHGGRDGVAFFESVRLFGMVGRSVRKFRRPFSFFNLATADKAVHAIVQLHEQAEFGHLRNGALNGGAHF